jgi:hypothetical protein
MTERRSRIWQRHISKLILISQSWLKTAASYIYVIMLHMCVYGKFEATTLY